jgi:fumarate reductase subunit D
MDISSLGRRPLDAALWALFAIVGLVAAMFAPVPTFVVATVLALMGAGGHRWRWVALAVVVIACLVYMLIAVDAAPIEQPVRVR